MLNSFLKRKSADLAFFHALPCLKSRISKHSSTPWIIFKVLYLIALYMNKKPYIMVLWIVFPLLIIAWDLLQFRLLWRSLKCKIDCCYLTWHLICDLFLLCNGAFVMVLVLSSQADNGSWLMRKIDFYYSSYRNYLIAYLCLKFAILLIEITVSRRRQ